MDQPVYKVYLLTNHNGSAYPLAESLSRAGMSCRLGPDLATVEKEGASHNPEAVLLDLESISLEPARLLVDQCKKLRLPVLAVLPRDNVEGFDPSLNPDELIFQPAHESELLARVKQAIFRVKGPSGSQLLRAGDMTIDLERYEVTVAGRRVSLR